ncbi:hypothetical protein [Shewanella sp. 6_MG-2023]|uniref:DUF7661 family protein n=1 Tax=Shewanella sp. 6_MG-2023 TaxID=3062660 RepID=UPI0026E18A13|nr:hypothetical protein [Shewanella sp. 6_MG-2023]MDO6620593.1 hypothetical protein [Shewanella sp. 6_MG-2023]
MMNEKFIKFDVFGKSLSIKRQDRQSDQPRWLLFRDSGTGLRSRIHEVIIPPELKETELAGYLDDIFHENATAKHSQVLKLT